MGFTQCNSLKTNHSFENSYKLNSGILGNMWAQHWKSFISLQNQAIWKQNILENKKVFLLWVEKHPTEYIIQLFPFNDF